MARMSGSGATCFALFDDTPAARDAAQAAMPSEWWTMAGALR
jgi:4-diphosphocytidyl-2-C-methyl-D-erythritol kinase